MSLSYLNGKIYSITCLVTHKVYIGCTAQQDLNKRINSHISSYRRWKENPENHYCSSYEVMKDNCYCVQIVDYVPCDTKKELEDTETWYIRNTPNCINKSKTNLLSLKEYQKQYHHAWHLKNKEQQSLYHKVKYQQKKNQKISQCILDYLKENEAD
jgi:hypothetical protein